MSIMSTGVLSADPAAEKLHKKSFHRRNDSGELDVFEAARYFSGYEAPSSTSTNNYTPTFSQKMVKEDRSWRGGRISLDMPIGHMIHHPQQHPHHHHHHHQVGEEKPNFFKDKKYKQPSSPGGRLASFLNSLFSQSASKKKSKSSSTQSMKDEEESPGARRRRRSSISHFRSSSAADSKSIYSSSSSDFRTPPLQKYAQAVASKSYKDTRSQSEHKQQPQQVVLLSKNTTALDDKKSNRELSWLDHEKLTYTKGFSDKIKINSDQDHKGFLKRLSEVVGDDQDEDDGAESDSSSDLFELQNYDLGCYSSGLPVYETTNVDNIKIRSGTHISNASS